MTGIKQVDIRATPSKLKAIIDSCVTIEGKLSLEKMNPVTYQDLCESAGTLRELLFYALEEQEEYEITHPGG